MFTVCSVLILGAAVGRGSVSNAVDAAAVRSFGVRHAAFGTLLLLSRKVNKEKRGREEERRRGGEEERRRGGNSRSEKA